MSDELQGESRFVGVVAQLTTREPVPGPDGRSAESWLALVDVAIESADTVAPLRQRMFHYYDKETRHPYFGANCNTARAEILAVV